MTEFLVTQIRTKNQNQLKMKELTYTDIREQALEHGIKDTKLHIGLWANDRYIKKRKMRQGKTYTIYLPFRKITSQSLLSNLNQNQDSSNTVIVSL